MSDKFNLDFPFTATFTNATTVVVTFVFDTVSA
jgi:hypothetical protein